MSLKQITLHVDIGQNVWPSRQISLGNPAKELKMRLRAWQNCDDLTRRMSEVELVLGERKLEKNDATMDEEGWLMFGAFFFGVVLW